MKNQEIFDPLIDHFIKFEFDKLHPDTEDEIIDRKEAATIMYRVNPIFRLKVRDKAVQMIKALSAVEMNKEEGENKCIIHNGRFAYEMKVDNAHIYFQGGDTMDYFYTHYIDLGYEVILSGNGTKNYKED